MGTANFDANKKREQGDQSSSGTSAFHSSLQSQSSDDLYDSELESENLVKKKKSTTKDMMRHFKKNRTEIEKIQKHGLLRHDTSRNTVLEKIDSDLMLDSGSDELQMNSDDDLLLPLNDFDRFGNFQVHTHQKKNLSKDQRRYIKRANFVSKFMQELAVNEHFDLIQRFIQSRLVNDAFIQKIIAHTRESKRSRRKALHDVLRN